VTENNQTFPLKEMAELERRRLVAASLRGTLAALNSDLPVDKLLNYIVNQAIPLLNADAAAIYHLQMNGLLVVEALVGLPIEYIRFANIPIGSLGTGRAALTKKPTFVKSIKELFNEPNISDDLVNALQRLSKKYRSLLSVPIDIRDENYGTLTLYFSNWDTISDEDIALVKDFSIQAALAIDNARLRLRIQQDAITQERNRLARELHDSVTQNLFSASLIAETLPKIMERDPQKGLEGLHELSVLTKGALAEMRSLLLELRPHAIEESRLEDLLRQLSETAAGKLRKPVTFVSDGQALLPVDVRLTFYRIAQESINNIAKHAEANNISIELHCDSAVVDGTCKKASLTITDDGCGFDTQNKTAEHLGFTIMQERAKQIGAVLSIQSKTRCGTTINLMWAIPETEDS
jgi:two-component system nitrate/nitrite sensor histidine kinase NarX